MAYGPAGSWVLSFDDARVALVRAGWGRFHDMPALEGVDWSRFHSLTGAPLRALEGRDIRPDTVVAPALPGVAEEVGQEAPDAA